MYYLLGHGHFHRFLHGLQRDAVPAHQQPVGIYAVGRTGHQGNKVLPFHRVQVLYLIRLHHQDLIHLIEELLPQNAQGKMVAQLHLVQIGEKQRRGQPPVAGKHRVGALSAHRQGGTA